ncbi:Uncharacterised protein [Legionella beliardensis]|uniref:Uncharacterized protein n=1 Tax=Legionella beliardensis TaxID=91822 RepID=A0A378IA30_9GAMM|nr:hypothetical protein [Legionella beliardensis]STX29204.1 Uncharacterised protein [Legionella beliardensis]
MKIDLATLNKILAAGKNYNNVYNKDFFRAEVTEMINILDNFVQKPSAGMLQQLQAREKAIKEVCKSISSSVVYGKKFSFEYINDTNNLANAILQFVQLIMTKASDYAAELQNSSSPFFTELDLNTSQLVDSIKLKIRLSLLDEESNSLSKLDQKINEETHKVAQLLFGESESSITMKKYRGLEEDYIKLGMDNELHVEQLRNMLTENEILGKKLEAAQQEFRAQIKDMEQKRQIDSENHSNALNQIMELILKLESKNNVKTSRHKQDNLASQIQEMRAEITTVKSQNEMLLAKINEKLNSSNAPTVTPKPRTNIRKFFRH